MTPDNPFNDLSAPVEKPNLGELPPDNTEPQLYGGAEDQPAYQVVGGKVGEVPKAIAENLRTPRFGLGTTSLRDAQNYSPTEAQAVASFDPRQFLADTKFDPRQFLADAQTQQDQDAQEKTKYLS